MKPAASLSSLLKQWLCVTSSCLPEDYPVGSTTYGAQVLWHVPVGGASESIYETWLVQEHCKKAFNRSKFASYFLKFCCSTTSPDKQRQLQLLKWPLSEHFWAEWWQSSISDAFACKHSEFHSSIHLSLQLWWARSWFPWFRCNAADLWVSGVHWLCRQMGTWNGGGGQEQVRINYTLPWCHLSTRGVVACAHPRSKQPGFLKGQRSCNRFPSK